MNPWTSIATPTNEFNVQRVSDNYPLPLFWGKDTHGGYLFLIDAPLEVVPDKRALPDLIGIRIRVGLMPACQRIVLFLTENSNWEMFYALCSDLIRVSAGAENSVASASILIGRLTRWRDFLKRQQVHALSLEAVKGLVGELLFLTKTLGERFGWDAAVEFWKGPENAPQDFEVHDTAVEVKTQSGVSKPSIQINSIEQLNAQLPQFYLVVYTLASADKDADGAFTLNSLIVNVRRALETASDMMRERFENLIFQAGYIELECYDDMIFQHVATRVFRVTDEFPRLTVAEIPDGVTRITYQLSLEACVPFETKLNLGDSHDC
ncbi:MAG: PD-(D/E)XK motif protein [bacterium]